jgi:predicted metal-dependent phosphoesterase TrpH
MKIKKYLSIAIGLLEGMENNPHLRNADIVYKRIVSLEAFLAEKGLVYTPPAMPTTFGTLALQVNALESSSWVCEVKCFPMSKEDALDTYTKRDSTINFVRSYTSPSGFLELALPVYDQEGSKYLVEVSKGSEYEVISMEVFIYADKESTLTATLKRFINLEALGWYAGDLHHHSIYSSPTHGGTDDVIESPQDVAYSMEAAGLRFGALSDHHNILNHGEWLKTETQNFLPIVSKEISTSNGHVMALNVFEDVIYAIPSKEDRSEDYLIKEFERITAEIKCGGGLAQINHPKDLSGAISLPDYMIEHVSLFDTMEIWNGSNPMLTGTTNDAAKNLWLDLLEAGTFIPATTGSDTHNIRADDYHTVLARLSWLVDVLKPMLSSLPTELQAEALYLISLYEKTTPILEKWAEENLSSGRVRTYLYSPHGLTTKSVLTGLKNGNSFLTNGPILIPSIEGAIPGETIVCNSRQCKLKITLLSNKPLTTLSLYLNGGKKVDFMLQTKEPKNSGYFDYSMELSCFHSLCLGEKIEWFFVSAFSDFTNMAISNPIFIQKEGI